MGKGKSTLSFWIKMPARRNCRLWQSFCALHLLIAFMIFGAVPARCQNDNYEKEKKAYQICMDGSQQNRAGNYAQAKETLRAAVALDPTSYSGYLHKQLALSCQGLKDYQAQADELQTAMRFSPDDDRLGYDLAICYHNAGLSEQAIDALNSFIKRTKNMQLKADATRQLKQMGAFGSLKAATKAIGSNNLPEARKLLARAASFDPSTYSADVHSNLCYVLQRMGQPEQAIIEGKAALKLNPDEKTTVYTVGLAYQDTGNFNEAISWLRRYAQMETDSDGRKKAENFIAELSDDRSKQDLGSVNKPDYFDQICKKGPAESWPKSALPLKVYFTPCEKARGYRPTFKSYVIRAFDTWGSTTGKIPYKIVNDKQKANIVVTFTSDPLTMDESKRLRQKAGLTYVKSDENGEIQSADVQISTVNPFNDNKPVEDGECAATCMHEIGHSLGLGHSPCVSDIMYFGSSSKQTGMPTSRDKNTIARLYQQLPVVALAPVSKTPVPIKYLPPPAFMPPKPPDTDLRPPLFLPPPLPKEVEKLRPPVFLPPPLKSTGASAPANARTKNTGAQIPTNQLGTKQPGAKQPATNPTMPFFVPPPKSH